MFSIRYAEPADIKQIMEIEKDSFSHSIQEEEKVFRNRINIFPEGFVLYIDTSNGRAAGYMSTEQWSFMPDAKAFPVGHDISTLHDESGRILYISSFAVLKEYRGSGTGRKLFSKSVRFICRNKDIDTLALLVNEQWTAARHIYAEYGFSPCRTVPQAFPGADGIFMTKAI